MQLSFASLHLCLVLLLAGAAHAAPTPLITRETKIMSRQEAAALKEPTTVKTSNTADTMMGPVTEACVITLTPIKDDAGKDLVRVEKTCTLQMDGARGGNQENKGESNGGNNNNGGGNAKSSTSASSDSAAATSSSSSSSGAAATSTASGASSTRTAASSSSSSGAAASGSASNTVSGAAFTSSSVASGAASSGSAAATGSGTAFSQGPLTVSPSGFAKGSSVKNSAAATATGSASSSATGSVGVNSVSSAADTAATNQSGPNATTNFALPGTKVAVLPIGLGVFAGISVIALIVVGLVTYERTKYRKAFRQRKLAESGGAMGYGGMAQRQ